MSNRLEQFVRKSSVFEHFCSTLFAQLAARIHAPENQTTGDPSRDLPILKLTLVIPVLFQSFQARFFDRAGERGLLNDG
jgi:hypothetical protein